MHSREAVCALLAGPRSQLLGLSLAGLLAGCAATPFASGGGPVLPSAGAVVSEHPLATKAGLLVLEAGGNAADAAVATALSLAVVYPQAGNLGGGGFALWVPGDGEAESLNFRESTPAGYVPELYMDGSGELIPNVSTRTPLAVGVPGSPLGIFELYRRYGSNRFSFAQLCDGAIRLAEGGFSVDAWLAETLAKDSIRKLLTADPGASELFYPGGKALKEGERLVQPALAQTLRRYAARGPAVFYSGSVGAAMLEDLRDADERAGGVAGDALMTEADLEGYSVLRRTPVTARYHGHEVIGMGPPSSGGIALLQVLGILEGLPLDAQSRRQRERESLGLDQPPRNQRMGRVAGDAALDAPGSAGIDARALHWWIEAMRAAFADRAVHLGDPEHVQVPVAGLLAPDWIASRRVSIGERARLDVGAWSPTPPPESTETTHLSVIDRDGNAVSMTTTLNGSFGSGIFVEAAGFLLNNELDDFSIQPGVANMYGLVGGSANQLGPGRRPLSSMCPVVVRDPNGHVMMVLGSPGGPRIITAVTQVVLRVIGYGQSLPEAIRAPRIHQQWRPLATRAESGWDPALLQELRDLHGQPIDEPTAARFGSVQGIRVLDDGELEVLSDPRRGGAGGLEGGELARPALPGP